MAEGPIRIGTRGSALALAQTGRVAEGLRALGAAVEIVRIRTEGDRAQSDRSMMLGRGAFVKELERALLEERIDLAVHSAKDMPVDPAAGTDVVAFPEREDPRDALVSRDGRGLETLAEGARIGTESPRRRAFLLHMRPDLEIAPVRGNVDTRLEKLDRGEFDALVVAVAGLTRLGREERVAERFPPEAMLPAVGQGALAVQGREGGARVAVAAALDHAGTRAAVMAERAFLRAMGGGCRTPFAALAVAAGERIAVSGAAVEPDGREALRDSAEGPVVRAEELGRELARALLERGAGRFAVEPGA